LRNCLRGMRMIEVFQDAQEIEWRDFLIEQRASIFHTPEWKNFIYETFHYKPYYLFARDSSGRIVEKRIRSVLRQGDVSFATLALMGFLV
jgi:hypothetical protein